jgi:hypothetical protein
MYEIDIKNKNTNETTIIAGYSFEDAFRRAKLIPEEWEVVFYEYVPRN